MKELDGGREITLDAQGDVVYLVGRGFTYEFDRGMFERMLERELGVLGMAALAKMTTAAPAIESASRCARAAQCELGEALTPATA
ncbi:hypothetical protein BKA24_001735 [Microbacterium marinum]|uniref:Uncharacterized protein n=1 Tax=Microbacterium marinum TaxID=421115 RepID=A0A7W7FI38_9MICO|nr:hypothetical protein [Microbacterium marinum]MBB4667026.1 hypothetical protein [Microbacterium marinum]